MIVVAAEIVVANYMSNKSRVIELEFVGMRYVVDNTMTVVRFAFVAEDCSLSIEYWNKVLQVDPTIQQAKDSIDAVKSSRNCK